MKETFLLELKHVRKEFKSVIALDNVDFHVIKGEIHGLLGENGAGKSTLMNILYGLYLPDQGEILYEGIKVKIRSPHDSIKLGIGMVHQSSTLVPELTAVENLILGTEGDKLTLPFSREIKKIESLSRELGFLFPIDVKIKELSAGIKQKIEIVRALYRGAKLIILDEPTTSLVENEFQQLLKALQILGEKGVTVIFITHKIREVLEACDSISVLRKGKVQGTALPNDGMTKEKLVKLMFMEKEIEVTENALPRVDLPPCVRTEKPIVHVKNISVEAREKSTGLRNVSFDIHGGEILGIAAISGNGEKDLAEVLINPLRLKGGDISIHGKSIRGFSTLDVFAQSIFYTPEDRIKQGILPEGSIKENVLLGHHKEKQFLKHETFIDWNEVKKVAQQIITDFNVHAPNEEISIRCLSGGNIQKVIIGRAFVNPIEFLITHNPTSGLDISTVEFIFKKLVEARNKGGAILWINEDLDELMILSDRISILHRGELKGNFTRDQFDKYQLGLLMLGA